MDEVSDVAFGVGNEAIPLLDLPLVERKGGGDGRGEAGGRRCDQPDEDAQKRKQSGKLYL